MQMIHQELKQLKDRENPLLLVADKIAANIRVLCFDEFHVTDITDAMLLGGLFKALFERGIVLVTTSNEAPDDLYHGGLQRDRFLSAIALIKEYTHVVHIDSGVDYRLRFLDQAEIYHCPLDAKAEKMLASNFSHIAPEVNCDQVKLEVEGRSINTVRCAGGVVWFDFRDICDGPRGPADYIEIARLYQTVLIANVPVLDESGNDQAKRFMTLVDEFYDRNVKLIITAEAEPQHLYKGKRLAKSFQRTISRLNEMRTHDYLAKQHLS
jgi:cell division protein ZapE